MNIEKLVKKLVDEALSIDNVAEAKFVTVARLQSVEENGFIRTIDTNTAIIPAELVPEINPQNLNSKQRLPNAK